MLITRQSLRVFVAACFALSIALPAVAAPFGFYCRSDVQCEGLFDDLVIDKFTTRYPHAQWRIFVESHAYSFGDGAGAAHASVGVTPAPAGKQILFPRKTIGHIVTRENVKSAYAKQQMEREAIRAAVESLMAGCDDSRNCNLD